MIWSFFRPSVDIDAISEALSNLRLCNDEGRPSRATRQEVPRANRRRSISCTTTRSPMANPRLQFILIHLRERFSRICRLTIRRLSRKYSRLPRRPLAPIPTKTTAIGPVPTSSGLTTQGLYVVSSASATTSMTAAATSSHGHNVGGQRLRTASTRHDR
jgi:hypothetical protein